MNESEKMEHSKGPWKIQQTRRDFDPISDLWITIITTDKALNVWAYGETSEDAESNAARIVKCVNACRGVKDPETAISDVRSMIDAHAIELERLRADLATWKSRAETFESAYKTLTNRVEDLTARMEKAEALNNDFQICAKLNNEARAKTESERDTLKSLCEKMVEIHKKRLRYTEQNGFRNYEEERLYHDNANLIRETETELQKQVKDL